jgi:hypothetical protein
MSRGSLIDASRFELPRALAEDCYRALRERGRGGDELFIALTGIVAEGGSVELRHALVPEQICHHTPEGLLVTIGGEAIFELNRVSYERGEILAAQIHAHPGQAYHSGADDQLALVRLPGALSIVVPDFAAGPLREKRWSVHRRDEEGRWRPLPRSVGLELT